MKNSIGRAESRKLVGVQRGDHVYATLLAGIIAGSYEPGAKLLLEEVASAHGVSTTPVRDALGRLESRGVVIRVPYQGFFVRTFSPREIQDLYEVRVGLEVLAVALACSRRTQEHLNRLRKHQQRGEQALGRGAFGEYQDANTGFHQTILDASGNELLRDTMEGISLQMQMMIAQTIRVDGRPKRANREHARLIEVVESGDVQSAEALVREHVYGALADLGLEPLR